MMLRFASLGSILLHAVLLLIVGVAMALLENQPPPGARTESQQSDAIRQDSNLTPQFLLPEPELAATQSASPIVRKNTATIRFTLSHLHLPTPQASPTPTATPTATATPVPTATPTPTVTPNPTATATPTPVPTVMPEPTVTPSPTVTATPVPTVMPEPTATPTPKPSVTPTPLSTETPVPTPTAMSTPTSPPPTATPITTAVPTAVPTSIPAKTPKSTATPVPTEVPSPGATPKFTVTPIPTVKPTTVPPKTPVPPVKLTTSEHSDSLDVERGESVTERSTSQNDKDALSASGRETGDGTTPTSTSQKEGKWSEDGETSHSSSGGKNDKGVLQRYLQQLVKKIEKKKRYPRQARRKRWEGIVEVEIQLLASGEIHQLKLRKSSRYSILDKATLKAIKDAQPFPPFPKDLQLHSIKLTIPIHFRLRQN